MPPPKVMVETLLPGMLPPEMLLPGMLLRAKTPPRREMLEMAVGEGGDGGCRVLEAVSAPTPPMPPLETPPPEVMLETLLPGMLLVKTLPPEMLPPETLLPGMLLRAKTLPRLEILEMAVGEGGDGGCRVLRARLGMGR